MRRHKQRVFERAEVIRSNQEVAGLVFLVEAIVIFERTHLALEGEGIALRSSDLCEMKWLVVATLVLLVAVEKVCASWSSTYSSSTSRVPEVIIRQKWRDQMYKSYNFADEKN